MATIVLVHGAGHGGWCWDLTAPMLRDAGHQVFTPTLTGLGDRAHLLDDRVGLAMHIDDIAGLLRDNDLRDVILVGHSYGGPVITGAADREPERVAALVYLDTVYVASGRSVLDTLGPPIEALRTRGAVVDGVELILLPTADGGPFYGVTDPDEQAFMRGKLTAFPWLCFTQPLQLADPERVAAIPSFHVACANGPAVLPADLAAEAGAEGRYWELDTHHELMISQPKVLAGILMEIADR